MKLFGILVIATSVTGSSLYQTRDAECEQACHDRWMGQAEQNCDEGDRECFAHYRHEADRCVAENCRGENHNCQDRCHHHAQG